MGKYPFSKDELKVTGEFKVLPSMFSLKEPTYNRLNTPISPRENYLRVYRKEIPLWVPSMTRDCEMITPLCMPDNYARMKGGIDSFGIDWKYEPIAGASMVRPGTRRLSDINEWESELVFPDVESFDWKTDYEENFKPYHSDDRVVIYTLLNGFFERLADLTSFDDTLCSLLLDKEAVTAFWDKLTDWHIKLAEVVHDVYGVEIIHMHDDLGTQRSSFISPELYEEMLLPHHRRFTDAVHAMGMQISLHSCGSVGNLLPGYIKAGFDLWDGQNSANDKLSLMEKYGDELAQLTVVQLEPDMTPDDVRSEFEKLLTGVGKTGRIVTDIRGSAPGRFEADNALLYEMSREYYNTLM